jgi:hypothetical protein
VEAIFCLNEYEGTVGTVTQVPFDKKGNIKPKTVLTFFLHEVRGRVGVRIVL